MQGEPFHHRSPFLDYRSSISYNLGMIPLRDSTRSKTVPFVNYTIIALCGVVFLFELSLGRGLDLFIHRFAITPIRISSVVFQGEYDFTPLVTLFTSMFLHGGWMHLIGNMLYLYIFGDNVEDRLGHMGYLVFYLLSGVGAGLIEVYFHQGSAVPLLGASGAIAGIMGAYFVFFPKARVLTLIPLFVFFPVVEISAFFFLGFWFVLQFIQGSAGYGSDVAGGVAWWAHAGGFAVGIALLPVFLLWRKLAS